MPPTIKKKEARNLKVEEGSWEVSEGGKERGNHVIIISKNIFKI